MFGIVLGILAILLGATAFTANGLPLTKTKNLTGTPARVIGVICVLFGMLLVAEGIWSTVRAVAAINARQ